MHVFSLLHLLALSSEPTRVLRQAGRPGWKSNRVDFSYGLPYCAYPTTRHYAAEGWETMEELANIPSYSFGWSLDILMELNPHIESAIYPLHEGELICLPAFIYTRVFV